MTAAPTWFHFACRPGKQKAGGSKGTVTRGAHDAEVCNFPQGERVYSRRVVVFTDVFPSEGARMTLLTRPAAGPARMRTAAKSLLSCSLSISMAVAFPAGIGLPATARANEGGHGSAAPLDTETPGGAALAARDKEAKQDDAVRGLANTALRGEEAVVEGL